MDEFKTVGFLEPLHLFRLGPCAAESSDKVAVCVASPYQQYLQPYQKDGIRFLYKQFCQNQPGVILNDGPGHGKTVQVLLFLSAINVLLRQQPSLIICNSENLDHWKYHICKWIEKGKNYIGGPDNVFAKKIYFVATLQDLESISRREWAVLVVDDIELSNFTKKCHFIKAKYKIWLSNDDLMSDLVSLNQIYHWLAPQERTNLVSKFSTVGLDRKAIYLQTLDLQMFCDALLLRRANETCLPLIDPALHDKLFQQWIETYGGGNSNVKTNEQTNTTNLSKMLKTNNNNDLKTKIENQASSSHKSVARLKNKTYSKSESPKSKKIKLSLSKSSADELSFEFVEISSVKNEINERLIELNNEFCNQDEINSCDVINNCKNYEIYTKRINEKSGSPKVKKIKSESSENEMSFEIPEITSVLKDEIGESGMNIISSEVEKVYGESKINNEICNQNEFKSPNIYNFENDKVDSDEIMKKCVSDLDSTETKSALGRNLSFQGENSHSILESGLFRSKTPDNGTEDANLDIIERENNFALNSVMDDESRTHDLKISPRNVTDALKRVEEISNKQFKGTFLDSLF